MGHMDIVGGKEPIRLFKSDFLEFFTHIHPAVIVALWLPVVGLALAGAVAWGGAAAAVTVPVGFVAGLFLWTLLEYTLHRFVFHFRPRTRRQERISFLFHGVHHAQPMIKSRLVMPPVVSVPLAALVLGLYSLVFALLLHRGAWVPALFAGTVSGYLAYDLTHYSTHHFRLRSRALRYVRRHHMHHHFQTPDRRFGVTSPLWDLVFRTLPPDEGSAPEDKRAGG